MQRYPKSLHGYLGILGSKYLVCTYYMCGRKNLFLNSNIKSNSKNNLQPILNFYS